MGPLPRITAFVAVVCAATLLASCGEPVTPTAVGDAAAPAPAADPELLFLGAGTGVKVFDPSTARITLDARPAVPSQQGNVVFRAIPRGGGTEVAALDPATGAARWSVLLAEEAELRVVAQRGEAAVLGPVRPADGSVPGRATTPLVVVRGPDDVRRFDVAGNVEPETFSHDGSKLFLIDYLPPLAPEEYTLRLLDLSTGSLGDVRDVHGEHREPMRGTARTQVYSPDGTRLYTYYQILGAPYAEHGVVFSAFVHVLDLAEEWAHCVDLQLPFGTGDTLRPALAVAPDGRRVFVADQGLGLLGEIDMEMLDMVGAMPIAAPGARTSAAAVATDDAVWVAFDAEVRRVDRASPGADAAWEAGGFVSALSVSRAGNLLYVALPDRVDVYDIVRAEVVDRLLVGEEQVRYFDPGGVPLDATSDVVKCAC